MRFPMPTIPSANAERLKSAVFMLIANPNLVGCSTGRSARRCELFLADATKEP